MCLAKPCMTISQRKRVQRYIEHKIIRSRIETPSTHNQTLSAQNKERTLKLQGRKTKSHTNAGSLTFHGESGRQKGPDEYAYIQAQTTTPSKTTNHNRR